MQELLTIEDFFDAVSREGYVVITDRTRAAVAHPSGCPSVDASNFKEKVVVNERRNGRYYWVRSASEAHERLDAHVCSCT
jgi:hypothetical protein